MTRTEFADFAAQQDARNTIELNVRKYTLMLCDALEQNFNCLLYTSPSPRDVEESRMPSSA